MHRSTYTKVLIASGIIGIISVDSFHTLQCFSTAHNYGAPSWRTFSKPTPKRANEHAHRACHFLD